MLNRLQQNQNNLTLKNNQTPQLIQASVNNAHLISGMQEPRGQRGQLSRDFRKILHKPYPWMKMSLIFSLSPKLCECSCALA